MKILGSLAGATIFGLAMLITLQLNKQHLGTGTAIILGVAGAVGFTMMMAGYKMGGRLEAIVVDVIAIGIVLFIGPTVFRGHGDSRQQSMMGDISRIALAVEARATESGQYPNALTLDALARQIEPTYVKKMPRQDAYGNPFRYEVWKQNPDSPGPDHYAVASAGADGKFEKRSLRQYASGPITNFECDLVFANGRWVSYPEGAQLNSWIPALKDPDELFKEATALYRADNYRAAIPMFRQYLTKKPNDALANARLGGSYGEIGQNEDAIPYLEKAIALDATDWQSRSSLGLLHERMGKAELGVEWSRQAEKLEPRNDVVLNNLGIVLLSAGRASEAADAFQRAVSLAPNVKVYRENLARARKPS
jgi:Flp pilus assembly protein TadD